METINDVFAEFAAIFAGEIEATEEIVDADRLARERLDFSVESLEAVDEYLAHLREVLPEEAGGAEWSRTILWGGAYLGEVMRRNSPRGLEWVDYDDFVTDFPETRALLGEERALEVCAFLTMGDGGFTLPINKVCRFLAEGPENSVRFYASVECAGEQPQD
ncbi:hypothetical protein [Nocardia jejuensis]|uniref:hypothetical protein n=1 Tax=Nocardia jejuensis TaxID=328049 RepID=UPI00082FBA34|nr:hypothetical protein [Nocardia jejuensis]